MWQPLTVERALFRWTRWRHSIANYWVERELRPDGAPTSAETVVSQRMEELRLPVRPRKRGKRGRVPYYSDRMAVRCAALKDRGGMSYVKIAERLGLKITRPSFSKQSDVTVHLVKRGRKILGDVSS